MTPDEYREKLGAVVENFHALEFLLRAFLQKQPSARPLGFPPGTDIYAFPVGSELPESELTSYDSLGELISKFNQAMIACGKPVLDSTLVDIRDAIAHGRVSSRTKQGYLRLLKFDRPSGGKVRVVFNQELNEAWFKVQTERLWAAIEIVAKNVGGKIEA